MFLGRVPYEGASMGEVLMKHLTGQPDLPEHHELSGHGVVAQTGGFAAFTEAIVGADLPPLVSMFAAASTISGITGSSSGGLQIFMATFADSYLALGVSAEEIHRLVAMASGGFDSLPHCGAVIVTLQICQLTHKQGYKDIGVVTVIVPVIATLLTLGLAMLI